MEYRCEECGSDEIELEQIDAFHSEYVCKNCGNSAYYIENMAELVQE